MKKHVVLHIFLVWLVVYTVVTSTLLVIRATGLRIPLEVQTLFITAALVPMIMFVVGPGAARIAHRVFPQMVVLSPEESLDPEGEQNEKH